MNKTYYYTLDERHKIIQVYLIDKNFPILVCRFSTDHILIDRISNLDLKVKTFLIENKLYHEGSEIVKL